jgi:hypothetical protein
MLEACGRDSPREIADTNERAVVGFSKAGPQDDIAVLVVRPTGRSAWRAVVRRGGRARMTAALVRGTAGRAGFLAAG